MAEKMTSQEKNVEEFDLEKNVTIVSIAKSLTGFNRINSIGAVTIPPKGKVRVSRNEILSQVQNNNIHLCGKGNGAHATYYIDDAPTRIYLGFDSEDGTVKQNVFTDEKVKDIFAIKSQPAFENAFNEAFVTDIEKEALMDALQRLKINDYARIRFAEQRTGKTMM